MSKSHCCNDDTVQIFIEKNQPSFYHVCVSCEKPCFFQEDLTDNGEKNTSTLQLREIAGEDIKHTIQQDSLDLPTD